MAELVAQCNLPRHVAVSGCMQWSEDSQCLLPTAEGVAVLDMTLLPQKQLKIQIKCDSTEFYTEPVEPLGLNRSQMHSSIDRSVIDEVQQIKFDKVICPFIRTMGDILNIRHAQWEPSRGEGHPRLAVLAQRLLLYNYTDREWCKGLDISHCLYEYIKSHNLPNNTNDIDEVYSAHCCHVTHFVWSQLFTLSTGQSYSYIIACNSYGHFHSVKFGRAFDAPKVSRLGLPIDNTNISSVAWISSMEEHGFLAIGRLDGTCALIRLTSQLEMVSGKELELLADYREVAHCQQTQVNEMAFVKHNQVYVHNAVHGTTHTFHISETKYSITQATANSSHVYVATVDRGLLILNRHTGEVVQRLDDASPPYVTHGVALSPRGAFLINASQPLMADTYVYGKLISVKLYRLKSPEEYFKLLWDSKVSESIGWDSFLMIAHHMTSLPSWLLDAAYKDISEWNSLTSTQLQILYALYHCVVDKRHHSLGQAPVEKVQGLGKLKQLLTVQHMKNSSIDNPSVKTYISACEDLCLASGGTTHPHNNICPVCEEALCLLPLCQYECSNGHTTPACSNTLLPILSTTSAQCIQCSAYVKCVEDVPVNLVALVGNVCGYCGGRTTSDSLF